MITLKSAALSTARVEKRGPLVLGVSAALLQTEGSAVAPVLGNLTRLAPPECGISLAGDIGAL
jgi:hypothetical protein